MYDVEVEVWKYADGRKITWILWSGWASGDKMMTSFTPTQEQAAIVEFAHESNSNLIIQALAGAAKTSTLVLIAEALKTQ